MPTITVEVAVASAQKALDATWTDTDFQYIEPTWLGYVVVGTRAKYDYILHFKTNTDGTPITGNGTVSPQVPNPGVSTTRAFLYCDSISTLAGKHDLSTTNKSYAGKTDAFLYYKGLNPGEADIKFAANASLDERTTFTAGSITLNVNQ